jgi:hypothetical protein
MDGLVKQTCKRGIHRPGIEQAQFCPSTLMAIEALETGWSDERDRRLTGELMNMPDGLRMRWRLHNRDRRWLKN